jgi:hypothetical protein
VQIYTLWINIKTFYQSNFREFIKSREKVKKTVIKLLRNISLILIIIITIYLLSDLYISKGCPYIFFCD